jgi:predicted Zn-dependent protease
MILMAAWAGPLHALNAADASVHENRLRQLAAREEAALEQSGAIVHDAALDRYLTGVAARLWQQTGSDLKMPVIQVISDVRMEAYTYPNGYIFLTTGILAPIENEDQLAMIIAHEMVHYARHHAAALYDQFQIPAHNSGLSYAHHSRASSVKLEQKIDAAEYQADSEGLIMIQRAGYCQAEALTLISKLMDCLKNQAAPEALKDLSRRRTVLQALINRNTNGPACSSSTDARTRRFLGGIAPAWKANAQIALRRGDWDQADRSIVKYLALRPNDAHAYYLRGEILRRRNDRDHKSESVRFYKEALKIDPQFPPAYRALGELCFKAGRYRQAKTYFDAFLSLVPRDGASAYIKGYLRQCQQ